MLDLLSGRACRVKRETGEVMGGSEVLVRDMRQGMRVLCAGHRKKRFAATAMNHHSSRSHTAVILKVTDAFVVVVLLLLMLFFNSN